MNFVQKLDYLMKIKGISNYRLAKDLNTKTSTVSGWLSGREPQRKYINSLCNYFNVSYEELTNSDIELGTNEKIPTTSPDAVRIPVLGRVAAGIPIEAVEDEVDWEEIPASWTNGGKEYFGLKVVGDSMYPKYLENDTVIVHKTPCLESGQDCVVYINGYDATLKTVKAHNDGSITLIPFNREYAPKTYTKAEMGSTPVGILGVVVELRRKML